ncbi:hypothetical protein D3C80_1037190 [compost metagenome]
MLSYCLNKQENLVINLSQKSNEEELLGWKIPNILFPLAVIVFSLFAYVFLSKMFDWLTFFNLLVNGSILMAAFNRMSSMITYTSKIEFEDSKKLGINLRNVKMKISGYSIILVLFIALLYSHQVINKPFNNACTIIFQLVISVLFFWFAIDATKVAFLMQEAFLKSTYETSFRIEQNLINQTPEDNDIRF